LQLQQFKATPALQPVIKFSVIIPARNEEDNIGKCLQSILQQNYPSMLFEIIVIDDYSTDATGSIVQQFQQTSPHLHLIDLKKELKNNTINSYKKKAIEYAISQSNGDFIITTDADCIVQKNWLLNFAWFIQQTQSVFVAAPVAFIRTKTLLSTFQYLDFMTLQGITAASVSAGFHSMCNGANLCYKKSVFYEVNGFSGIDNIASGDDMLLMNKIKNVYPDKIGYLFSKDVIVETAPMPTWKTFINQRIRWASKADKYNDKNIFFVLALVYVYNFLLGIMFVISFFKPILFVYWLGFIAAKIIIELFFIIPTGKFFGKNLWLWFIVLQPVHIAYTVIAGWLGKFGSYQWKGRKVK
jgi:glycosyltransferase involved in cell wall biosynthesis